MRFLSLCRYGLFCGGLEWEHLGKRLEKNVEREMKHKKQILKFLEDNWIMIDSLMSEEERKTFGNHGVVGFIVEDIKNQIRKESEEN